MPMPVYLVNLPYAPLERPNTALGILKSGLAQHQIDSVVRYANLDFAEIVGVGAYYCIAAAFSDLLGEWTFADTLSPGRTTEREGDLPDGVPIEEVERVFRHVMPSVNARLVLEQVRTRAGPFIEQLAEEIVAARPAIVGCTTSFQQNCASLALLRRIRNADDSIITVLGGAGCEGIMGQTMRKVYPWVDFVVSGEADLLFPELVRLLLKDGREVEPSLLPAGVIGAEQQAGPASGPRPRTVVAQLDATPIPDYAEYFQRLEHSPLTESIRPGLPIETSRGCWWAAKRPCTFCGINGTAHAYRTKSPERVAREFSTLSERYHLSKFAGADVVLNTRDGAPLFSRLKGKGYSIFFETRVMDERSLERLESNGVRWIQVGIESFSDELLKLMNKGNRAIQNVWLLRRAQELGMRVSYNLMYGFPGDKVEWYAEMNRLLPKLFHLEPPEGVGPLRFNRFSDYAQNPDMYGLRLVPHPIYDAVYGLPTEDLAGLAYFYQNEADGPQARTQHSEPEGLRAIWREWRRHYWRSNQQAQAAALYGFRCGDRHLIYDTRPCAKETVAVLDEGESSLLACFERPRQLDAVLKESETGRRLRLSRAQIARAIGRFTDSSYLVQIGNQAVSVVSRPPKHAPLQDVDFPGGYADPIGGCTGLGST